MTGSSQEGLELAGSCLEGPGHRESKPGGSWCRGPEGRHRAADPAPKMQKTFGTGAGRGGWAGAVTSLGLDPV